MKRIITLTKRNFKEMLRDPLSLIFMIGLPLVMEILFYFLFHKMTDQFAMKYLAPGIVVFAQAFLCLFTGSLIATDRGTSFLTRLYVSKAKSHEFIFGYALSVLPWVLIQTVLFFLIGGIIDPSIFGVGMLLTIPVSLITSLFFITMGILFGSLSSDKAVGGLASIIVSCQSVLSGMWFPTEGMGKGFMTVMKVLPFRPAALLVQNTLNGVNNAFNDFVAPLLIVLGYTFVAFIAAILVYKSKMKEK